MKTITIFTPTYNRAYILHQLYDSLCRQTTKDFEWLIVDDGSTDETEQMIHHWILENRISIRYYTFFSCSSYFYVFIGLKIILSLKNERNIRNKF